MDPLIRNNENDRKTRRFDEKEKESLPGQDTKGTMLGCWPYIAIWMLQKFPKRKSRVDMKKYNPEN